VACAHAIATCAGWDGLSCTPEPGAETAAEREFALIDAEARRICAEGDDPGAYSGSVADVETAVEAALDRGVEVEIRFEHLRVDRGTPAWTARTTARTGALYECIWSKLNRSEPKAHSGARTAPGPGQGDAAWDEMRDRYLAVATRKMVAGYVVTEMLARGYALGGGLIDLARQRLPVIVKAVGDRKAKGFLRDIDDPTDPAADPTRRRRVRWVPGMASNDCRMFDAAP
jgi:hypothetical protein